MKKVLAVLVSLLLLCGMVPLGAISVAAAITEDGLKYTIAGGEVTITGYTDALPADVVIPDTIEGYPVTTIDSFAFHDCDSLTSVTIPNSVTTIGDAAFYDCASLMSVTIGDSVTTIGYAAFEYCVSLTSVTISDSVTTIGDEAFEYCASLTSVTIGNRVTSIGERAFYDCDSLTSVTIPDSVTTIGDYAFYDCASLMSVTIGASVTTIGGGAFEYCSSLTSLTIGASVTTIGDDAFDGCSSLQSVTIPDSVTIIGDGVFDGCSSLQSLTIGASVTTIGDYAFYDCASLQSVTIPDSVTAIGGHAFAYCDSLTSATIGASVTTIGDDAFAGCNSLTSVTIPDSVTTIGGWAFSGCASLTSVTIGASVTTIGRSAFYGCASLTSVTIPDSVTAIGDDAFSDCDSLQSVTIPDSVTTIGGWAFSDCDSLTSVTIGNSVTTIGDRAFYYCTSLTSVTIGNSVTTIGDKAFYYCYSLASVTIPDSVTFISEKAFAYCDNLATIRLPLSLTEVGDSAFDSCYDLTDVYYVGSPEDSSHIIFGVYNDYLLNATWHYNFTGCLHSYSNLIDPDCDLCGEVRELRIIEAGVDTMVDVTYGGEMVDFIFVPAESGRYSFGSYGDEDTYGYILDAHGNELDRNDDGGEDNQFLMKYEMAAGEVYILRARYYDDEITGSFPVRVDHKAIESITIDPLVIIESQQDEWGYYSVEDCSITVTYTDGTTEQRNGWDFDISTDAYALQEEQPWTVGNTYTVTATVLGVEVPFEVSIVPNPVVSVEVEPLAYVEYTHGYWTSDWDENDNYVEWYYYELDSKDLILTVTMLDGNVFSGSYYDVGDQLEEYTGIDPWTCGWFSNQRVDHSWSIDGSADDQTFSVTWVYHQLEIPVTIIETPIASIEVEDVVRIVGSGSWREDWNEMDEHIEWMYYDPTPETITVTLKDGTTASGSRDDIYGELGIWLEYTTDQSCDDPWGVGDHTATIYYGSFEAEYTVSVTESPIASIEIPPLTYMEGTNGYWEGYWDENDNYVENAWYRYDVYPWYLTYTVTLTDGTVYSGNWYDVREQLYGLFGDAVYNYDYTSDQSYDNQWGVGDHVATLTWLGQMVEYTVTITEPPIASIEVEDISIMEGTDGYVEDGQYYYENFHCNGVVTFKDGTTQTFDGDIEIDGHWYYVSTNAWDLQQEQPWTVGNTYTVTGTVMGVSDTFEVTIIPGPVASFTIEDMVMYEGLDSDGDGYGVYPPIAQVVMKDGSLGELVYGDLYYDGSHYGAYFNAWDMQYEEPWTAGNTYTVTATLIGVTTTFNVTILPHPIESIEVVQAPDKTVYGLGEKLDIKGMVLRFHYTDGTYEDISFDKTVYHSANVRLNRLDVEDYLYIGMDMPSDPVEQQEIELWLFGVSFSVCATIQENSMESLTVREEADKSIVITVHNSDGTTTEMELLDLVYVWPWDEYGYEWYGTVLTSQGIYNAHIYADDDSFSIGLMVDAETYVESNTIGHSDWFAVISSMLSSNLYCFPSDYILSFNREVTAENIDAVVALAMYRCSFDWWDDVEWVDDGSPFGWMVFDAALVRQALAEVFGWNNVDLTLSQHYDAAANTFMMYNWINSGGEVNFDEPSDIRYENGVWYVTVTCWGETVYFQLNDDLKIVAAGIHADIPTVEPVVPAAKPGDANGDGRINNRDLGLLQQYLADWGVALDPDVMDLNNDGRVNNRDLGLLQQYLADWDVELK